MKGFAIFLFILMYVLSSQLAKTDPIDEINFQTEKFKYIIETIHNNYPDTISIRVIAENAFNAMLTGLDKQSAYYPADLSKLISDRNKGTTESVGLTLISIHDTLTVITVIPGSSSDSAGISPGDKIIYIDGKKVIGVSVGESQKLLNGTRGNKVNVIYSKLGETSINESLLTCLNIPVTSINSSFILPGSKTGFISSNGFSAQSGKEFHEVATNLLNNGINSLILDLRGNPGGYLEEACKISDELIKCCDTLTYTKAKNKENIYSFISSETGLLEKIPLIVLIDRNSASGSEIIAGALQDLDRGLIIGETSYGKGTAQRLWEFKDGSSFKLTVANYFTPTGRLIEKPELINSPVLDPGMKLNLTNEELRNLNNELSKTGGRTSVPVYHTPKGRSVIGGGGIIPDFSVKNDTTTILTKVLREKGVFIEYVLSYLALNIKELKDKYNGKIENFESTFNIDDSMMSDFIKTAKLRNVWNDEMYKSDERYIKQYIKASIGHFLWGAEGFTYILTRIDKTINRAMELMPQAVILLN